MSSAHSGRVGKPSSSVWIGAVRLSYDDNSGVQFQVIHSLGESPRAVVVAARRRRWMDVVRQDGRRRIRGDQVGEGGHWRRRRERRDDRRLYRRRRRRRRLFLGIVRGSENATTGFGVFRFTLSQSLGLGFRIAPGIVRRQTVGG